MQKLAISKEWTPAERLQLIAEIVRQRINKQTLAPLQEVANEHQTIYLLTHAGADFLEGNRQAFSRWISD